MHRWLEKWRAIRRKEFFYILETKNKTDLIKRRELGGDIYSTSMGVYFVVVIMFVSIRQIFTVNRVQNIIIGNLLTLVLFGMALIILVAIIFSARYYFTNCYFYLIPIAVVINMIGKINSIEGTFMFFGIIIGSYVLFTLFMPVNFLRKITATTLVYGAIFSILIPLLLEHTLSLYFSNSIFDQFNGHKNTLDTLLNSKAPQNFKDLVIKNPIILDFLNDYIKLGTSVIVNDYTQILSKLNFLWLSSYTIGIGIINCKIKIAKAKAEDLFTHAEKDLKSDELYETLRNCVFYGGEEYKTKILSNSRYKEVINEYERNQYFYIEKSKKAIFFTSFLKAIQELLKKMI